MIPVKGKYAEAIIYTDIVDEASIAQVMELCNQEFVSGSRIRLMPDIHAGAGCTIGTTMTIADKVCPNLVGVDIGCGMQVVQIKEKNIDMAALDACIQAYVPSGFDIRETAHPLAAKAELNALHCAKAVDFERAAKSIGTLGGGNHFIEIDGDDEGTLYLVIHTGSRHLGVEIASYYQRTAYEELNGSSKEFVSALIAQLKAEGKQQQIEKAIKQLRNTKKTSVPKELAYVQGKSFDAYIDDMRIAQDFAALNRKAIAEVILCKMNLHAVDAFQTIHNYIDTDAMILRKGAVSAKEGERLIIPMNARDGSLLCIGKGNPGWNYSAPHGAGRLMSRAAAKQAFGVEEFAKEMSGIFTTSVGHDTLDECPMAYKPMQSILDNVHDTVEVEKIIRPVYNFKACGG